MENNFRAIKKIYAARLFDVLKMTPEEADESRRGVLAVRREMNREIEKRIKHIQTTFKS